MPILNAILPDGNAGYKWGHFGNPYPHRIQAEREAGIAPLVPRAEPLKIAMDAESVREYDVDGRLHVSRTPISKACVNPYMGREIPGWESLGLDPNRIYRMLRHPDELAKAASSFHRNPILSKHIPINAASHPHELVCGSIGSDVEFVEPYLYADLAFWENQSIGSIEENSVRQLSAAYHYVPIMTPGNYNGDQYDGIMTEITGNHLALVEVGRAGSDVLVQDAQPEIFKMPMTKRGKALVVSLGGLSTKIAQDASLPSLVGSVTKTNFDKPLITSKILAMDADVNPKDVEAVMDGFDDDEDDEKSKKKPAQDSDEDDEAEKKRKAKVAEDEAAEKNKTAMDAAVAGIESRLKAAHEARIAVQPIVGDVAMDSAAEIYGFALKHMEVAFDGVDTAAGRKALFDAIQKQGATKNDAPVVAMDSASISATYKRFPGLERFA